ncbi:MAG: response regulator [Myxococcales bacterium]
MARRYFTTYEASQFLGVSLPTVVNWIKAGRLKAHRTPGGHRRIARDELASFIRRHAMPMPPELAEEGTQSRILVVDDDAHACDIMTDVLERAGYTVRSVSSGFAAGLAIGQFKPDLVLLDLMMPGMDGFTVVKDLRGQEATANLPILAVTAMTDDAVKDRVKDAGFNGLVHKPFEFKVLLGAVDQALKAAQKAA